MPRLHLLLKVLLACSLLTAFLALPSTAIPVCDGVCDGPGDCPDDCAYCGDGFCNGSETSSWCPADCGASSCLVDTCGTCNRNSAINDNDSIPDQLEYDLAHAFFPAVTLKNDDRDLQQTYLYQGKAIPFTVREIAPKGICNEQFKCLEIRYGLAYFQDFGDSIKPGHLGDSEFYAAVVMRTQSWPIAQGSAGYWQMVRDFTAAHWGDPWTDSSAYGAYGYCHTTNCSNYGSPTTCEQQPACSWSSAYCDGIPDPSSGERSCFRANTDSWCYSIGCTWHYPFCYHDEPVTCYSSTPSPTYVTLYASEKKHALYHSDWECDHGGFQYPWHEGEDECPATNLQSLRNYKGELLQNVGNPISHSPDILIQYPDRCKLYDVWGPDKFGSPDTTAYSVHFNNVFGWGLIP